MDAPGPLCRNSIENFGNVQKWLHGLIVCSLQNAGALMPPSACFSASARQLLPRSSLLMMSPPVSAVGTINYAVTSMQDGFARRLRIENPMQAFGRNQMISSAASQGVVSDEFATGNGLASSTAPMILSLFPAGAKLTSTGEVILWGYLDDPMRLSRRSRGTQEMVATLKRPPPARRTNDVRWRPPGIVRNRPMVLDRSSHLAQKLQIKPNGAGERVSRGGNTRSEPAPHPPYIHRRHKWEKAYPRRNGYPATPRYLAFTSSLFLNSSGTDS
jgi:hypothetical protein